MKFGQALLAMEGHHKVARSGWNGKGMWVYIFNPPKGECVEDQYGGTLTHPFIVIEIPQCAAYPDGALIPWVPSQADMLADDWYSN